MGRTPTIRNDRWHHERSFWDRGMRYVAGVDEVGRGPLAGPVVAVAAILRPDFDDPGVTDSKVLTPARRIELYPQIADRVCAWSVGAVETEEIDRINILQATFLAMRRALQGLPVPAEAVIVDGRQMIPGIELPQRAVIGGDRTCISVGAASILAKEIRDRIMEDYDTQYPVYGFARHKGYATPEHTEALEAHGPCPIHRRSFAPLRLMQQNKLSF